MKVTLGNYKKKGERKIAIKLDAWDSWSADETLARIAVPLLKQLQETKHGHPIVDVVDTPYSRDEWKELTENYTSNEAGEKVGEVWDHIMDTMIYALESCYVPWEDKYFTYDAKSDVDSSLGSDSLGVTLPNMDKKGYEREAARIEQGLIWFGKYFRALWD